MLTDSHTHIYWDEYKADFTEVIKRSFEAGVTRIINIGVNVQSSRQALEPDFSPLKSFTSIGIHPHEAIKYHSNPDQLIAQDIAELETIYQQHKDTVVLVGECGLDFFFQSNDLHSIELPPETVKQLQRQLFQAQIDLAKKLDLPITVHCRDDRSQNPENVECWNEVLNLLKDSRGILHCYSGLGDILTKAQKLNFLISFAGNITYPKNQYLHDAATQLPLSKILLETDSPFLSPQSSRGQRNEPKSVREIAELIANLKGITTEEVATQTNTNLDQLLDSI